MNRFLRGEKFRSQIFPSRPNPPAIKTNCQISIDISESRIGAHIMVSFVFSWFIVTDGDSCVTEDLFTLSPGSLPFLVFIFHFFALFLLGRMRSRTWQRAFACCFWTDSPLIRWDQSIPDTDCDYSAACASWRSSFPQTSTLIP